MPFILSGWQKPYLQRTSTTGINHILQKTLPDSDMTGPFFFFFLPSPSNVATLHWILIFKVLLESSTYTTSVMNE